MCSCELSRAFPCAMSHSLPARVVKGPTALPVPSYKSEIRPLQTSGLSRHEFVTRTCSRSNYDRTILRRGSMSLEVLDDHQVTSRLILLYRQ
jgi:hypothetical protein